MIAEKGNVKVFWDNKLVLKGQPALFECQAAGWYPEPSLQWQVDDKLVRTHILYIYIKKFHFLELHKAFYFFNQKALIKLMTCLLLPMYQ